MTAALASERQTLEKLRDAQQKLIQAEKMASLGQLVAGMAHEINTPVGNALTSASYLVDATQHFKTITNTGNVRRSEFNSFVTSISDTSEILIGNIRRAVALIESFKKVATGRTLDEKQHFALAPYLRDVALSLEPTWRRAGLTLELECPETLEIDAPPGEIAQIITNLVVNSATHGFPDGETGTITLSVTERDTETMAITYRDNGRGILPEHRPLVFDPFFTTKRGSGNAGLGLNIVYNLVTSKLGGRVELACDDERGVRFEITLPRNSP